MQHKEYMPSYNISYNLTLNLLVLFNYVTGITVNIRTACKRGILIIHCFGGISPPPIIQGLGGGGE